MEELRLIYSKSKDWMDLQIVSFDSPWLKFFGNDTFFPWLIQTRMAAVSLEWPHAAELEADC